MYNAAMQEATTCGNCGAPIDVTLDPPDDRRPCGTCGSTSRVFEEHIQCSVALDARMKGHSKHRRPGRRKPYREEWFGEEFFRKEGRWTLRLRAEGTGP